MQGNTIEILSSINQTVSKIATMMAPQNTSTSSAAGVSKLSQGNISSTIAKEGGEDVKIKGADTSTITSTVKLLSAMSPAVLAMGNIPARSIRRMKNVVAAIISINEEISKSDNVSRNSTRTLRILSANSEHIREISRNFSGLSVTSPLALVGITLTIPVFKQYVKLMDVISSMSDPKKQKELTQSIKNVTHTAMEMTAVVGAVTALGVLVSKGDTQKIVLAGLAGLGAVMLATTGVIMLTGLAGKVIKHTGALDGMKIITATMLGMTVVVGAMFGLGAIMSRGDTRKIIVNGLVGLGAVMLATAGVVLLTGLATRLIVQNKAMNSMMLIIGVTVASMGIIVASKFLGDFIKANDKSIKEGILGTTAVITLLGGIAFAAGKLLGTAKKGIVSLATVELLALGAMGLVVATTKLHQYKEKAGLTWGDIEIDVLGVSGVLGTFGVLAGVAGVPAFAAAILAGSAALGAVELLALGSIKVVDAVMALHKRREDSNTTWKIVEKDVLGLSAVIGTFGGVASAFSVLALPIAVATPAMVAVSGFALGCIGIMNKLFDLQKRIEDGGGTAKMKQLVNTDIPGVLKGFSWKNYNPELSLVQIASLSTKYAALAALSVEFLVTATALSKLARIGNIISGKNIVPITKLDENTGEMKTGDPVDIQKVATSIIGVVKSFVEKCNFGFKDVAKMMASAVVFRTLGTIVNPITKFINMLTGFTTDGKGKLTPIRIDDSGNIIRGEAVDVKAVSGIISDVVSSFVETLYSDDNAAKWAQYIYGREDGSLGLFKNKKTKAIKKVAGILGTIVSPITEFTEMLTQMEGSADGTTLRTIDVDAEGNIIAGKEVNVKDTAMTIATAISTFVGGMFTEDNIEKWNSLHRRGRKALDTIFESMTGMVSFVQDISDSSKIDNTNLEKNIASISKLMDVVYREDLEGATSRLNDFNVSTINVKTSIKSLDDVLSKESNKRKKNMEDFGKSIEDLLKKFDKANDTITTFYELVKALQNMDASKVSSIVSSMNLSNYKGGTGNVTVTPAPSLTPGDITDAIRDALDGMHISGGSMSENQSMDDAANAIIMALKDMRMDIDLNK